MAIQKVFVIGGGTFSHVRNHLSLAVEAFGETAIKINDLIQEAANLPDSMLSYLTLTKMADPHSEITHSGTSTLNKMLKNNELRTNADVSKFVDHIIAEQSAKIVFFNVALCDFDGQIDDVPSGKYAERLKSRDGNRTINLSMADKIISKIRKERKDIFLVAFKTTAGATEDEQYIAGLNLLKANSCNLVLANDTVTRKNMIIVPEEARYCVTTDRNTVLKELVNIAIARSQLSFTRSTVVPGETVDWNGNEVPQVLRDVVNHCIEAGAYKPFRGSTAGHFAYKVTDNDFITSKRKTNYNNLDNIGLVRVESNGPDSVIAHGAKPSVGGQSQRIVFAQHPDVDCIVHFHCPPKASSKVNVRSQKMFECGSHECGKNTSDGLTEIVKGIKAVYLDEHGPNIVFNKTANAQDVIQFIEDNFDLSQKTGGLVT